MSKHAVEAFGDALAGELGRFGVRVSLIEPGNYGTEIGRNVLARMDTAVIKGSRFESQMVGPTRCAIQSIRRSTRPWMRSSGAPAIRRPVRSYRLRTRARSRSVS